MSSPRVKILYGGASLSSGDASTREDVARRTLEYLENKVDGIDTAQGYSNSEDLLGKLDAAAGFNIDTKYSGILLKDDASAENVIQAGRQSLQKLHTKKVDVYYIHGPDRTKPFDGILKGINELYIAGAFKRFGICNFTAVEVETVVRIAKENNYVLPTVYQGNYSAIARRPEKELLPTLRKYGIAFNSYNSSAGGFLAKTSEQVKAGQEGRVNRQTFAEALDQWGEIANEAGISRSELDWRWVAHHSALTGDFGDAVIFGARNQQQLEETVTSLKNGPLSNEIATKVNDLWELVKHEARLNNDETLAILEQKSKAA